MAPATPHLFAKSSFFYLPSDEYKPRNTALDLCTRFGTWNASSEVGIHTAAGHPAINRVVARGMLHAHAQLQDQFGLRSLPVHQRQLARPTSNVTAVWRTRHGRHGATLRPLRSVISAASKDEDLGLMKTEGGLITGDPVRGRT